MSESKTYTLVTMPDVIVSAGLIQRVIPGRQMIVEGAAVGDQVTARSWVEAKQKLGFDLTPRQMEMLGRMAA